MESNLMTFSKKEMNEVLRAKERKVLEKKEKAMAQIEEAEMDASLVTLVRQLQQALEAERAEREQWQEQCQKYEAELVELKNTEEGALREVSKIVTPAALEKFATEGLDADSFDGTPHLFSDFLEECADSASDEAAKILRKHKKNIKTFYQRKKKKLQEKLDAQVINNYDIHDNNEVNHK